MAELVSDNYDKRVFFKDKDKQITFLSTVLVNSGLSCHQIAGKLGIVNRTLFDWRRGKYLITLNALGKLCELAKMPIPRNIEIRNPFWSAHDSAIKAGAVTYKKYGTIGNSVKRKQKWQEWWDSKGKFNPNQYFVTKHVNYPDKSDELSEFVGIIIGDGGITERQVNVTLNSKTDLDYCEYVNKLTEKLFGVKPSVVFRNKDTTVRITVSRTNLVKFCQNIGLKVGNKIRQQVDIPSWIKENNQYLISCIRGLVDTDGCIFNECHKIGHKVYSYSRLSFVSASLPLRLSMYQGLKIFGFSPKIRNNRSVQLENRDEIVDYFDKIGTNNPKHRKRFEKFIGGVG